jgi:hypothetical protein
MQITSGETHEYQKSATQQTVRHRHVYHEILRRKQRCATERQTHRDTTRVQMRCYEEEWASTRALHVCDSANAAPQTARAYAMMRSSCESADAVLGGGGGVLARA